MTCAGFSVLVFSARGTARLGVFLIVFLQPCVSETKPAVLECAPLAGVLIMPEAVLEAPTTGAPSRMVSVGEAFKAGDMAGYIERLVSAPNSIGESALKAEDNDAAEEGAEEAEASGEADSVASPEGQEPDGNEEQEEVAEEPKVEPKEADDDELPPNIQKAIDKRIGREV